MCSKKMCYNCDSKFTSARFWKPQKPKPNFFCFWIPPCVQKYSTMRWPAAVQHWWQLLLFSFFFDFFVTISHGCVTYFLCITTTPISQRAAAAVCCCFFVVVEKIEPKLRREKRHSDTIHTPENSIVLSLFAKFYP